jgi:hypothetical protein
MFRCRGRVAIFAASGIDMQDASQESKRASPAASKHSAALSAIALGIMHDTPPMRSLTDDACTKLLTGGAQPAQAAAPQCPPRATCL